MATSDTRSIIQPLDALIGDRFEACAQEDLPALVGDVLCEIVDAGLDTLPLPGDGATLARWRMLAAVASHDLSLAKLYEAHTDALAILAEAGVEDPPRLAIWGVWCAEAPGAALVARHVAAEKRLVLDGDKAWCSGAISATHGLLSYRDAQGAACLAMLDLGQDCITTNDDAWKAVGMAATRTATLHLSHVAATPVGAPGFYLDRAGFWHGAIGIAACWFGAAAALAGRLKRALAKRHDPHALAHLGHAECHLAAAALCLRNAAAWIDANPLTDGGSPLAAELQRLALRTRLQVEHAASAVATHVGRALGPAPYCCNRRSARLLADLPVFMRQSHAERDLAQLGTLCTQSEEAPWLW